MREALKKRFLVIGCGSIGRRHIRNLSALGVRDFVLLDPDRARLKAASEGLSNPVLAATMDEAMEARPHAALICSPTSLHMEQALRAAREGLHLFIEKPLSHDLTSAPALGELVRKKGLTAMMAMCYRFHPVLLAVKERLGAGAVGRVYHVNYFGGHYLPYWHRKEDYRKGYAARAGLGGGVLLTSIHGLDTLRWLFGEVAEVKAFMDRVSPLEMDVEDLAMAVMRLSSGAYVSWQTDFLQRAGQHRLVVVGERGTMRFDIIKGEEEICGPSGKVWKRRSIPFEVNSMYLAELEHFIRAMDAGRGAEPGIDEGIATLELAMRVRESAGEDTIKKELRLCQNT